MELGFLSTTTERGTALGYAAGGSFPMVMVIERGMVDRGASVSWCSQYLAEQEVLFPPLCALEVRPSHSVSPVRGLRAWGSGRSGGSVGFGFAVGVWGLGVLIRGLGGGSVLGVAV